ETLPRARDAVTVPVPDLARLVARPHEQDAAVPLATGSPRREDCFRFGGARQEVEVRAGPVLVEDVAVADRLVGRRQQQQAVAQRIESALPPGEMKLGIVEGVSAHGT